MTGQNNQNSVKHGGEGAIRRISEGKPFIGLAADEQKAVEAAIQEQGITGLVRTDAIRLQSALNLYWNAVLKAAQDGDLIAFDRYIARYGWLAGVTLRALEQVAKDEKGKGGAIDQVLEVYARTPTGTAERGATGEAGINDGVNDE